METPKTKMQMVREYLAEHPEAKAKEIAEAVGCHVKLVRFVLNPERYQRVIEYTAAVARKRYHDAHPNAVHNVSRHQQWLVIAKTERSNSKPYVRVAQPRKPAERPVSNEAAALQRECERLLDEMALCTTAEYPALARRYSEPRLRPDNGQRRQPRTGAQPRPYGETAIVPASGQRQRIQPPLTEGLNN